MLIYKQDYSFGISIGTYLKMYSCIRPYHVENTSSRPITEVKQHWAALVLGWVTAWEYAVLYSFLFCAQI